MCTLPDEAARPIKEKINISEVSRTQLLSEARLADTVKESKPTTIIQALKLVEATGEFVTVTYAYGSRPEQERDLAVLCLINNNQAIRVIESVGKHEEKTYVINRIMEVQLQDGSKFYNTENIERFRAWKQENDAYQSRRRDLINICSFGTNAKLKECRFEVSRTNRRILDSSIRRHLRAPPYRLPTSSRLGVGHMRLNSCSVNPKATGGVQHILVSNRVSGPIG